MKIQNEKKNTINSTGKPSPGVSERVKSQKKTNLKVNSETELNKKKKQKNTKLLNKKAIKIKYEEYVHWIDLIDKNAQMMEQI